jgi:hypothetical protein
MERYRQIADRGTGIDVREHLVFFDSNSRRGKESYKKDGKPLPPATSGRDYANKMQRVA